MTSLTRRLDRLEGTVGIHEGPTVFVCLNHADEAAEEAVTRHRAEHPDTSEHARFLVVHTGLYRSPGSNL